jgi:hypothetical protein
VSEQAHPWRLVAPWYRWSRFPKTHPRDTPPVLQKYETAQLVDMFIADPQHSLQFTDDDWVQTVVIPTATSGRSKTLSPSTVTNTDTRKLYLPTHKRFYLVVCELHCDMPGFPSANRDEVCQAGMVVRRRRMIVPENEAAEALRRVRRIGKRTAQIAALERRAVAPKMTVIGRDSHPEAVKLAYGRALYQRRVRAAEALYSEQRELAAWAKEVGAHRVLEGWVPSELEGVGDWAAIEDEFPQEIEEATLPLYPLIADPSIEDHSGGGRTLWFGLLPTGGAEVDVSGTARYDDATRYEVACFVRRHNPSCPRRSDSRRRPDCRGEVVWSRPTDAYQLASHFDLVGTSNRPVTIQMPDIPALMAQAGALPFGQGVPVRVQSPAGSSMQFGVDDGKPTNAGLGGFQICSFSIPLITIVAMFLFRLFLPIVVLLFGLFVLLRLKLCIPPSISASAEVDAAFAAMGGGIDIDADLSLRVTLGAELNAGIATAYAGKPSAGDQMTAQFENSPLVVFQHEQGHELPAPAAPPATEIPSPNGLAKLIWEERVPVP